MNEISPAVLADLAPDGVLPAAINFGKREASLPQGV